DAAPVPRQGGRRGTRDSRRRPAGGAATGGVHDRDRLQAGGSPAGRADHVLEPVGSVGVVQRFETVFEVEAPPKKVWGLLHMPPPPDAESPRKVTYPGGSMEIWSEGDSKGEGLVRNCVFRVPRYLLSGGKAQSWEVVWKVVPLERAHYRGVGKPLWSRGEGWH